MGHSQQLHNRCLSLSIWWFGVSGRMSVEKIMEKAREVALLKVVSWSQVEHHSDPKRLERNQTFRQETLILNHLFLERKRQQTDFDERLIAVWFGRHTLPPSGTGERDEICFVLFDLQIGRSITFSVIRDKRKSKRILLLLGSQQREREGERDMFWSPLCLCVLCIFSFFLLSSDIRHVICYVVSFSCVFHQEQKKTRKVLRGALSNDCYLRHLNRMMDCVIITFVVWPVSTFPFVSRVTVNSRRRLKAKFCRG